MAVVEAVAVNVVNFVLVCQPSPYGCFDYQAMQLGSDLFAVDCGVLAGILCLPSSPVSNALHHFTSLALTCGVGFGFQPARNRAAHPRARFALVREYGAFGLPVLVVAPSVSSLPAK